jgi:uncharacterized membrane protein YphA (DoxX/SURF4 family)
MFPRGGPGFALLLLRISVAAIFLISVAKRFGVSSDPLIFAISLLISICLGIGFLTPYLSVLAFAAALVNLLIAPNSADLFYVFPIIDAAVLALLGPGAYSVDARLFGLRVSVVPPRKDLNRP